MLRARHPDVRRHVFAENSSWRSYLCRYQASWVPGFKFAPPGKGRQAVHDSILPIVLVRRVVLAPSSDYVVEDRTLMAASASVLLAPYVRLLLLQ